MLTWCCGARMCTLWCTHLCMQAYTVVYSGVHWCTHWYGAVYTVVYTEQGEMALSWFYLAVRYGLGTETIRYGLDTETKNRYLVRIKRPVLCTRPNYMQFKKMEQNQGVQSSRPPFHVTQVTDMFSANFNITVA